VPNLSFGAPLIKALKKISKLPLDVHLMVAEPEKYIEEYADLGAAVFTFHPEATLHVQRQLARVRERGMKAGLALNPASPIGLIEEVLEDLDLVLVMSVNPGFGGQRYIEAATDKIGRLRGLLNGRNSRAALEVDGGITLKTIRRAWQAGADTFVAGTAVFGEPDPAGAIKQLKQACTIAV
jgi:ribulose-phosphate 3-epimerase